MNKTRVDDMLIEMIEPKIQEINKKFTTGKPLSQDDINTLLLKSQYNHINHLDIKLDETVESVKLLENKFEVLKTDVNGRLNTFEEKMNTFEEKLNTFEEKMNSFDERMDSFEQKVEQRLDSFEQKVEGKLNTFEEKLNTFEQKMEATIQKALNKNMMLLIFVLGFFLTLSKLLDYFMK